MTLSASYSPQSVDVDIQGQSMGVSVRESERVPTPGPQGEPGFSPIVSVDVISGGHEVTITDEDGNHVFDVMDGENGQIGRTPEIFTRAVSLKPGTSPYADTTGTVEQPLITFGIPDGQPGKDGSDGTDGVSPEVTIATITGGHSVTITDADHPGGQTFNVMDGERGAPGTTDYTQLTNKPSINGTTISGNVALNVSDFPNDAGYLTLATLPVWDGGVE